MEDSPHISNSRHKKLNDLHTNENKIARRAIPKKMCECNYSSSQLASTVTMKEYRSDRHIIIYIFCHGVIHRKTYTNIYHISQRTSE